MKQNNNNTISLTKEDIANFMTCLDYLKDDLKTIDCPDFDCNAFELLFNSVVVETLQKCVE